MTPNGKAILWVAAGLFSLVSCGRSEDEAMHAEGGFHHGVASGDPLEDRVVLWTRVTPETGNEEDTPVTWTVARDCAFTDIVASGEVTTNADRDYTVKVDVTGLEPGTTYYYQFAEADRLDVISEIGRTHTLAADPTRLRLAVVGCTSYQSGYFNSYRDIVERDDVDFILHLGDYIYEYGADSSSYNAAIIGRNAVPAHEAITLGDFRARYAQSRSDPDLKDAHRWFPFIAIWDDHEVADDVWNDGSANFEGTVEDLHELVANGKRAYAEWMPIRETERDGHLSLYRHVRFGTLADFILLDTRLEYRDESNEDNFEDPNTTLIGTAQEAWLYERLDESQARGATWRLLGSPVMMAQVNVPEWVVQYQTWNGFTAARSRVFDHILTTPIDDVVVLAGDLHAAAAVDIAEDPFGSGYDPSTGEGAFMTEFVANSMTGPKGKRFNDLGGPDIIATAHEHFRYFDDTERGYLLVDVTESRVIGEFYHSENVLVRNPTHVLDAVFRVDRGSPHVVPQQELSDPGVPTVGERCE